MVHPSELILPKPGPFLAPDGSELILPKPAPYDKQPETKQDGKTTEAHDEERRETDELRSFAKIMTEGLQEDDDFSLSPISDSDFDVSSTTPSTSNPAHSQDMTQEVKEESTGDNLSLNQTYDSVSDAASNTPGTSSLAFSHEQDPEAVAFQNGAFQGDGAFYFGGQQLTTVKTEDEDEEMEDVFEDGTFQGDGNFYHNGQQINPFAPQSTDQPQDANESFDHQAWAAAPTFDLSNCMTTSEVPAPEAPEQFPAEEAPEASTSGAGFDAAPVLPTHLPALPANADIRVANLLVPISDDTLAGLAMVCTLKTQSSIPPGDSMLYQRGRSVVSKTLSEMHNTRMETLHLLRTDPVNHQEWLHKTWNDLISKYQNDFQVNFQMERHAQGLSTLIVDEELLSSLMESTFGLAAYFQAETEDAVRGGE